MRSSSALALLLLMLAASADARARASAEPGERIVEGRVFLDVDADGRRDADEAGVAGVKLSNGRELVISDAHGRYRIALRDGDTLFLVKPPQASLPRRDDRMPAFWRHHFPSGSPPLRHGGIAATEVKRADFALLAPEVPADTREVLVFGDPQPKREQDVGHYARDIVAPLLGARDARLGLSLGDIVDDDLSLYPAMKRVTAMLELPWLHLPGNHDLDLDARHDRDSLLSYRAQFGPDTYAWEEHDAVFVLLDDVIHQPGERPAYIGGLRDDQFAFLDAYLATLDGSRLLVLAAHIPLHDPQGRETFRRADRERLFARLARFPRVLLLTSHAHAQRHHFHDADDGWHGAQPLHEYVVGASCGGFWSGLPDEAGLPDARMADGTPNGYARLAVGAGDHALEWRVAREPVHPGISLHAPRVLRRGAYPAFAVSANVFMGMDDTRVEYRIDGGEWKPMSRALRPDPALLALNAADDAAPALRAYDRAVEATPSTHLWRGALPTDLAVGEHEVEVRAHDRWRGVLQASIRYRLDDYDAAP